jgi:hypothetical protein
MKIEPSGRPARGAIVGRPIDLGAELVSSLHIPSARRSATYMSSPPRPPGRSLVTCSCRPSAVGSEWCALAVLLTFGLRFSASVHVPFTRCDVQMSLTRKPPGRVEVQCRRPRRPDSDPCRADPSAYPASFTFPTSPPRR